MILTMRITKTERERERETETEREQKQQGRFGWEIPGKFCWFVVFLIEICVCIAVNMCMICI